MNKSCFKPAGIAGIAGIGITEKGWKKVAGIAGIAGIKNKAVLSLKKVAGIAGIAGKKMAILAIPAIPAKKGAPLYISLLLFCARKRKEKSAGIAGIGLNPLIIS